MPGQQGQLPKLPERIQKKYRRGTGEVLERYRRGTGEVLEVLESGSSDGSLVRHHKHLVENDDASIMSTWLEA